MRYVSLFSGIEAASVAFKPLGWEPVAFSEIDNFASAVLAYHYPDIPNLGDITKIDWSNFKNEYGTIDLIIGGSPCQSFSVAGKREGLKGESGLMYEYIRAVREILPRWFIWENVPGALSSEKGYAFGQLLAEMDEFGYGMAWRVLDAQFFGVPQRRRRVFLIGRFGEKPPTEILFDSDSLRWDFATSKKKREELTEAFSGCTRDTNCKHLAFDPTQITHPANGSNPQFGDPLCTLSSNAHTPVVVSETTALATTYLDRNRAIHSNELAFTLDTNSPQAVVTCLASDTSNAALDSEMVGTLLVSGGAPILFVPQREKS